MIPFLIIYLHDVRHIGLGTSGFVVAELLGIGLVGSPLAGRLVDRIGARTTLMASLALLAAGYGGFPFVRHPWQAFGLAAIAGVRKITPKNTGMMVFGFWAIYVLLKVGLRAMFG